MRFGFGFVLVMAVLALCLLFGCASTLNPNEKAYNITAKDIVLQASDVGYGYQLADGGVLDFNELKSLAPELFNDVSPKDVGKMQQLFSGYYAVYTPQHQDSQQNGISITLQAVQLLSTCDANQVYSGGVTSFSNINNMTMNGIHIISVSKIVDAPKFGDESASFQVSGSLSDYNQPANAIMIMSKKNNQLLEVVIWDFGNSNAQLQQQSNQLMTKMIDKLDTLTIKAPQLENNVCSSSGVPIAELIGRFLGFVLLYVILKGLWDFWHNGVQNTLDKGNKILDEKFGKEKKKKL